MYKRQVEEIQPNEDIAEESVAVDDTQVDSTVEVIESIEVIEEDTTASGRLASLRDELGEGEGPAKEGSIEDRMKEFFGDGS